jgi:hypothetical protein
MSSLARALGTAAAQLGSAVARTKKKTTKQKKGKPKARGNMVNGLSFTEPKIQTTAAPIALGQLSRRIRRSNLVTVPFSCANVEVNTNSSSTILLNTTASTSTGGPELDLHPIANGTTGQAKMFGYAIASLASSFSRWRLKSLRITYHAACATSTAGLIRIAYSSESAINGGVSWNAVSSSSTSLTVSPWQTATFDIPTDILLADPTAWNYCYPPTTPTTSDDRISNQGCLLAAGLGLGGLGFFGELEMSGVLEFKDLFDETDLLLHHRTVHSMLDPSCFDRPASATSAEASSASSSLSSSLPIGAPPHMAQFLGNYCNLPPSRPTPFGVPTNASLSTISEAAERSSGCSTCDSPVVIVKRP